MKNNSCDKCERNNVCCHYMGNQDFYDEEAYRCPICGAINPNEFYVNEYEECVGCSDCVHITYELY